MNGCLSFIKIPFKVITCLLCFLGGCLEYIFDKNSNFKSVKHIFWFSIDAWSWEKELDYSNQEFKKGLLKGIFDLNFFNYLVAHILSIFVILDYLINKNDTQTTLKDELKYHFKTSLKERTVKIKNNYGN